MERYSQPFGCGACVAAAAPNDPAFIYNEANMVTRNYCPPSATFLPRVPKADMSNAEAVPEDMDISKIQDWLYNKMPFATNLVSEAPLMTSQPDMGPRGQVSGTESYPVLPGDKVVKGYMNDAELFDKIKEMTTARFAGSIEKADEASRYLRAVVFVDFLMVDLAVRVVDDYQHAKAIFSHPSKSDVVKFSQACAEFRKGIEGNLESIDDSATLCGSMMRLEFDDFGDEEFDCFELDLSEFDMIFEAQTSSQRQKAQVAAAASLASITASTVSKQPAVANWLAQHGHDLANTFQGTAPLSIKYPLAATLGAVVQNGGMEAEPLITVIQKAFSSKDALPELVANELEDALQSLRQKL